MGKGDIKTKKGKRHIGSFGRHRPHKVKKAESESASAKASADKKPKAESSKEA